MRSVASFQIQSSGVIIHPGFMSYHEENAGKQDPSRTEKNPGWITALEDRIWMWYRNNRLKQVSTLIHTQRLLLPKS